MTISSSKVSTESPLYNMAIEIGKGITNGKGSQILVRGQAGSSDHVWYLRTFQICKYNEIQRVAPKLCWAVGKGKAMSEIQILSSSTT